MKALRISWMKATQTGEKLASQLIHVKELLQLLGSLKKVFAAIIMIKFTMFQTTLQ